MKILQQSHRSGRNLKYQDRLEILATRIAWVLPAWLTKLTLAWSRATKNCLDPHSSCQSGPQRSYLEGKPDLGFSRLHKILRLHYQEKGSTEMYQLLSSPVQEAGVTSQDFLVHNLDIRQKVFFAFQEAGSDLKYDPRADTVYVSAIIINWATEL